MNVFAENDVAEKIEQKLPVALISSDFAMQNVAKHMKMNLVSVNGLIIKILKSYVLRCR